ncbi:MAG TPA: MerR family DNA-binding transcriptional regulator, partial [Gemmatimonadales bacterium]|nr:MerR family DNA-binding transcriptional regulator [Gemmatimonadales bacterium]
MSELLSLSEAAALLGVSVQTLRRWDREGKLRAHRNPVNGYRQYARDELRALLAPAVAERAPGLVGRAQELAELERWFAGGARVVTLVGPPGVGKSALARALVDRLGGARWLTLDEARDAAGLFARVAAALEVPLTGAGEADERLGRALARQGGLWVLDASDGVIAEAAIIARWAATAPRARFLITAREPLRIAPEKLLRLSPLPEADALT